MKGCLDFQLNLYFNMYKDTPLPNCDEFRKKFKKMHGKFPYLNELIVQILNYQVKRYGQQLPDSHKIVRKEVKNGKYKKGKKTWYL